MKHRRLADNSKKTVFLMRLLLTLILVISELCISVNVNASLPSTPRSGTPLGTPRPPRSFPESCGKKKVSNELAVLMENREADLTASDFKEFALWFYIPYENLDEGSIEFSISDEKNTRYVMRPISITISSPGMLKVDLSKFKEKLDLDTNYRWTFQFYCSTDKSRGAEPMIGYVQRRERNNTSEEFAYDRINRVVTKHFSQPGNSKDWINLLNSLKLHELIDIPLATK
jgi:Domain of Unknown Function (DUF928)